MTQLIVESTISDSCSPNSAVSAASSVHIAKLKVCCAFLRTAESIVKQLLIDSLFFPCVSSSTFSLLSPTFSSPVPLSLDSGLSYCPHLYHCLPCLHFPAPGLSPFLSFSTSSSLLHLLTAFASELFRSADVTQQNADIFRLSELLNGPAGTRESRLLRPYVLDHICGLDYWQG